MLGRNRTGERMVALFLLGAVLLLPPLLLVFNRPERVLGVPLLYLYLFAGWAGLIALAAAVARRIPSDAGVTEADDTAEGEDGRDA